VLLEKIDVLPATFRYEGRGYYAGSFALHFDITVKWPYYSFLQYVEQGIYADDWGGNRQYEINASSDANDAPPGVGSILPAHLCLVLEGRWSVRGGVPTRSVGTMNQIITPQAPACLGG